ncbi:MAG: hypothetical protein HUJ27_16955 [Rhodobacteraceae bacterium]|nr:hypothetical protein [Paracoccaceae bacterium]
MKMLKVEKLPTAHVGRGRVMLHYSLRDGASRHQVVKITNAANGKCVLASSIGNDGDGSEKTIGLDYDLRTALAASVDQEYEFEIRKVGFFGTLWWYLTVPDPLVRVGAWLAAISVFLGALSIFLAVS